MMLMRNALKYVVLVLMATIGISARAQLVRVDTSSFPSPNWIHVDGEFMNQVQSRDSILIGDQIEYGFQLDGVEEGTVYQCLRLLDPNLEVVEEWKIDTLNVVQRKAGTPRLMDIRMAMKMAAFEEGTYAPLIMLERVNLKGKSDTLYFDPIKFDVKTLQLDSTFVMHDVREQIHTPFNWDEFIYTLKELWAKFIDILPVLTLVKWGVLLLVLVISLLLYRKSRKYDHEEVQIMDPAHIVALRKLDAYRSNAMWVPEKQKDFYTGVTDALREYISRRYGIGALEMTTAELFDNMGGVELPQEQMARLRELFERADFVKFAKYVASDEDNASAVPLAVRFVTDTYQSELEQQTAEEADVEENK